MPKPEQKKENLSLRVNLDYGGDLVHGAVRLGRAVEQMTDDGTEQPRRYILTASAGRSSGKRKLPSVMPRTITKIGQ